MARKKLLRVISRLWRHDSAWPRWGVRSLNKTIFISETSFLCLSRAAFRNITRPR